MAATAAELTIQQKQQQVTAQLLLLLSQKLPVCDWNISSLHGHADGLADTTEAVRAWAAVIAGGIVTVTQDGRYLETHGVGGNERIRVWAKRPVTKQATVPLEEVSQRAALKVLTRAADALSAQASGDTDLVGAIRGAATLYTPFGPQASKLAEMAMAVLCEHLRYAQGNPAHQLNRWTTIRTVDQIVTELRAAGGGN